MCEEFYRQGEENAPKNRSLIRDAKRRPSAKLTGELERRFALEISPLCDQQADSVPAIQTGEWLQTFVSGRRG